MEVRKIAILVILMSLLVGCVPAQDVATPETPTVTEETVTPTTEETVTADTETPAPSEVGGIDWLMFLVLLVIGTLIVFPWLVITYSNIHIRNRIMADIHDVQNEKLKKEYYEMLLAQIPERKGLSRFSLMLAVTLIIGTAVLYLVIKEPGSELLETIIGVLTGALASIIGFFFGGRAAESASEGPNLELVQETAKETAKKTIKETSGKPGG
ncbi:hypothetical protein SZ63_07880 [Methanoculleus sediminis]|uniref:Uncharacterized protein n=2 Tax=Methanoculleus sediminis TaxID=1550566 RepID=A0A0H1QYA0_9EURY|nr:hypothetical protein SZ63_07880 [Methanoculleus sediminis]